MDYLSLIKQPIETELNDFVELFNGSLSHSDGLLGSALTHIRQRGGKRMRPMLILLIAKNFRGINEVTQNAAVGLELLHTSSLIHDDVVDESKERRGQPSVNASYDNRVAVLVGDYVLSAALIRVAAARNHEIVHIISVLGQKLAAGELLQLSNIQQHEISEESYYQVINQKTASLFEACSRIGAISANATNEQVEAAAKFGQNIGMIFQIRDDIFDYFDSAEIGKPTGNDMMEGKLTLPVIYALNNNSYGSMLNLARKVKAGTINSDEIAVLVEFTKQNGGIDYAVRKMEEYAALCRQFIDEFAQEKAIKDSLTAYLEYVIQRRF